LTIHAEPGKLNGVMAKDRESNLHGEGAMAMTSVTLEEAQARLPELVAAVERGEEVVITKDQRATVKLALVGTPITPAKERPQFGSAKGKILYMAEDFDATPEDFKEYLE